jgi:hypothetical protein
MAAQGHEETCGFALPLHLWPEAAGRQVWASFDAAGELRLPPLQPVQLPLQQSAWLALAQFSERNDCLELQQRKE